MQLRRKREARQTKLSKVQRDVLATLHHPDEKRVITEEHKERLRQTVEKFNKNCYSEKGNN